MPGTAHPTPAPRCTQDAWCTKHTHHPRHPVWHMAGGYIPPPRPPERRSKMTHFSDPFSDPFLTVFEKSAQNRLVFDRSWPEVSKNGPKKWSFLVHFWPPPGAPWVATVVPWVATVQNTVYGGDYSGDYSGDTFLAISGHFWTFLAISGNFWQNRLKPPLFCPEWCPCVPSGCPCMTSGRFFWGFWPILTKMTENDRKWPKMTWFLTIFPDFLTFLAKLSDFMAQRAYIWPGVTF